MKSFRVPIAAALAALTLAAIPAAQALAEPGVAVANRLRSDVNGDSRDDLVNFTRGSAGDVHVAISTGALFQGKFIWHRDFAFNNELPLVGDFNGDGRHDIVTFARGGSGDVYVALSTGGGFTGTGALWNNDAVFGNDLPVVGDFNGDGRDDIASLRRGGSGGLVEVALSTGSSFAARRVWHNGFLLDNELPDVGDFNGDGRDDIASFLRGGGGQVLVALSTGLNSFSPGRAQWHPGFAFNSDLTDVGDFNGDGRADIVGFTRGSAGDVFVALSSGSFFAERTVWHNDFSFNHEIPGVGDFNGDRRDDIVTFHRGSEGAVFVALSSGSRFEGTGMGWHPQFSVREDLPQPSTIIGPIVF